MQVQSIKEFVNTKKFTQIVPVVRENTNKYPFITFIGADNKAENVYFSKELAKTVTVGSPVTKDLINSMQVATVTNELGEERLKLISNSTRVDINSLLD